MLKLYVSPNGDIALSSLGFESHGDPLEDIAFRKEYLQKHINTSFSLDDLCHTIGINKSYLCRKFKEVATAFAERIITGGNLL